MIKFDKIFFESIDSTNEYAKQYILNNTIKDTIIVHSNEQTNGKGRYGKHFYSPKNTGIYMSIIMKIPCKFNPLILTIVTCLAVSNVLDLSLIHI